MKNSDLQFPQRKIKKSYRSITGHFPSIKNKKAIAFESALEKTLFLSLEFDDSVKTYKEQPQIELLIDDKKQIYSADCFIKRVENSKMKDSLVEAKYEAELASADKDLKKKFAAAKQTADSLGLEFYFFTEKSHPKTYIENLDFLYRYKLNPINNKYNETILKKLKTKTQAKDLARSISSQPLEYSVIANTIWSLDANNALSANLYEEKLTMNSFVEDIS